MKNIRWGIAGPGFIAHKFARAVQNAEGAELVAVASNSQTRGAAFAEEFGIPHVFSGYEQMAASDLVDAVYVATPHSFHKSCAEIFLRGKKHVLCEKPICVNAAQAMALRKTAEENGVFLMEAMWTRFLPAVREACRVAASGEIGEVLGVRADFCYASTPEEEAKLFDPKLAGGSLLDVGVYGLTFADLVLGEPKSVTVSAQMLPQGVDGHTNLLLQYENGAIASVSSAIAVQKPEDGYIYGSKGYIHLPCFYGAQELFVYVGTDAPRHISKPSVGGGFEEEIMEACACIRAGKTRSDIHPMSQSIKILKQMDAIRAKIGLNYPLEGE